MFKLKKEQLGVLKIWLPLAIIITCLCGLVYLGLQQNLRIGANDPQIQIAEDIANQLAQGQNPHYFIPTTTINLNKSLATYIMIFDKDGNLIGSSVSLDGKDPVVPKGVFAATKTSPTNERRFTWQPKTGVRSAVVINYYKGPMPGFVLIGRSIREVELREDQALYITLIAWAITMIASFLVFFILSKIK